jgi:hypothetical protein
VPGYDRTVPPGQSHSPIGIGGLALELAQIHRLLINYIEWERNQVLPRPIRHTGQVIFDCPKGQ